MVAPLNAVNQLPQTTSRSREERTVVFTDIVESTHLKQTLGDARAIALFEQHDAAVRGLLSEYAGARELGVAGDSFTLSFVNAADALLFSLRLHTALEKLDTEDADELRVRIGIHSGELFLDENVHSGRPIGGMALDVCARIMSLADRGQTLLSRHAFDEARRALAQPESLWTGAPEWLSHGLYQLKGAEEPMEICEVGLPGHAPLKAPAHAEKARRLSTPDGELVLGWRPAVGREVPGTSWKLERPLGEGGFGEVWLGQHTVLKERRVFKFCFRADRVRSLKREVTLFRVLREHAGQHPNIVGVHDVYLNEPPFYVAMDYVEGNALPAWIESHGGFDRVPLETRVDIVAQVAEALHAAHAAGVLHRDVKPGNILMSGGVEEPLAKLSDFGIGQVLSLEALGGVTAHGLTQTLMGSSSGSGTQMYLAPEVLRGQPSSQQSDVFALGVVLYQAYVGDFLNPLTTDWEEAVQDPLIREDLRKCFASDPAKRFATAERLAECLRAIPERRAVAAARRAEVAAAERRAFRAGVLRTAFGALAVVALFVALALFAWGQAGRARKNATAAENARSQADTLLEYERQRRAGTLFENDKVPGALAYLAAVVRKNPKEVSAAERLVYALLQRPMAWPVTPPLPHDAFVDDLAITPDGRSLLVITAKTTRLWDITTGMERAAALPVGGQRLALSRDGTRAVVVGDAAHLIDLTNFRIAYRWSPPSHGSDEGRKSVDFRPQGDMVAVLNGSEELTLWDPQSGSQLGESLRTGAALMRALFSPDGKTLAVGDVQGQVWLWDVATRTVRWKTRLSAQITAMAWHPSGKRIAAGADNGSLKIIDAESGALIGPTAKTAASQITDIGFSPDGREVCASSLDSGVDICSGETGAYIGELKNDQYKVWQAQFTADGSIIVARTGEGLVRFYDPKTRGRLMESLECDAFPHTIRLASDGRSVAIGGEDGNAQVWKIDARSIKPLRVNHQATVNSARFQSGGKQLVTAGTDGRIRMWDLEHPENDLVLAKVPKAITNFASTDGAIVASTEGGTTWRFNRRPDGTWPEPQQMVPAKSARFSRDGSHFLLQRLDGMVQLFETSSGRPVTEPSGSNVKDAIVGRGGLDLIWVEGDSRIRRLDVKTGRVEDTPIQHKSEVSRLAVSPSGNWLASISRDVAAIWNLESRAAPLYLPHGNQVTTFEFSADDRWAVATSLHRAAHVWRLPEGIRMPEGLTAQGQLVTQARFVPGDSRRVWTVDLQAVRFWDATTSLPLSDPLISSEEAEGVIASPGGERIVVLRKDKPDFYVVEIPSFPMPAPSWLADWAEAAGGLALGSRGVPIAVPTEKRKAWRESSLKFASDDSFGRALRWWLEDARTRPSSPFSPVPALEESLLTRPRFSPRDPQATPAQIDLTPFYASMLDQDPSTSDRRNTLEDLSAGLHRWNGIAFDARGVVQLGLDGGNMERFPHKVEGITVGQKCRALHWVGAVRNANGARGDEVLRLVVHYADGATAEGPMRLGIDVGDWWLGVISAEDRLVWTGTNPASREAGDDIGVYHMRWENPRPDQPIATIDFLAFNRGGAPFVIALTAEP
jgi:WD40 repeat protein/class 3 adenylate cyclase/tRNA A-37 threonylcarbamoyl transferase component Bud32